MIYNSVKGAPQTGRDAFFIGCLGLLIKGTARPDKTKENHAHLPKKTEVPF